MWGILRESVLLSSKWYITRLFQRHTLRWVIFLASYVFSRGGDTSLLLPHCMQPGKISPTPKINRRYLTVTLNVLYFKLQFKRKKEKWITFREQASWVYFINTCNSNRTTKDISVFVVVVWINTLLLSWELQS